MAIACRGNGLMQNEYYVLLFPDGRIHIKEGFHWMVPTGLFISQAKIYIPTLVYSALQIFKLRVSDKTRKKIFQKMMKRRKVNTFVSRWLICKL